jgi:hypothetical protein
MELDLSRMGPVFMSFSQLWRDLPFNDGGSKMIGLASALRPAVI